MKEFEEQERDLMHKLSYVFGKLPNKPTTMQIEFNSNKKQFIIIVLGGLEWCANDNAMVQSFSTMEEARQIGLMDDEFERLQSLNVGDVVEDEMVYGVKYMRVC